MFEDAFDRLCRDSPRLTESFIVSPWATFGDEFQFVCSDFQSALQATTLLQLNLAGNVSLIYVTEADHKQNDHELKLRFGLGAGSHGEDLDGSRIFDGPGWIAARSAINRAQDISRKRVSALSSFEVSGTGTATVENLVLALRDHTIYKQRVRESRICYFFLVGMRQEQIAAREKISQSAVSQSLQRSGGYALMEMFAM